MEYIVILGKGSVKGTTIPTSLKVWSSKFNREVGDKITFEGEVWTVQQAELSSKQEAIELKNSIIELFIEKGYWKSVRTFRTKF